jgi:hypothetical protein
MKANIIRTLLQNVKFMPARQSELVDDFVDVDVSCFIMDVNVC